MKYQLVALGPATNNCVADLRSEFEQQITDIGLDPKVDSELIEVNSQSDVMRVDWSAAPVGIWFGDQVPSFDQHHVDLAEDLLKRGAPLFPVCETTQNYTKKVPPSLVSINAHAWKEAKDKSAVVSNVLAGFRLTPSERNVFISYRRDESRGVAVQVFEELVRRKYTAFLDTASVPAGVTFQEVLTGRLSGVDLVIFLDTPNAVSSQWVYAELNQAHTQGMGIVQVLWPGRPQSPGTGFCDPFPLQSIKFVNGSADASDTLKPDCLGDLMQAVERTRIRSIRHRRERVIGEILTHANQHQLTADVYPVGTNELRAGNVELLKAGELVGRAFTVLGLPSSILVQERCDELDRIVTSTKTKDGLTSVKLIYDELGIHPDHAKHLQWLNEKLDRESTVQTLPLTTLANWIAGLK